jgi:hypothetical protein
LLERVARVLVSKGNVLLDQFGDHEAAEAAYHAAMNFDETSLIATKNLAWLYVMTTRPANAEDRRAALTEFGDDGLALLDAGIALADDNFGVAVSHLGTALKGDFGAGAIRFFNDLLRFLRLAEGRGYGEKLIEWFETSGAADRYAPVHAAFIAYVRGERFLLDINPEVRRPAQYIFSRLTAPRRASAKGAAAAPATAARRPRRRKVK